MTIVFNGVSHTEEEKVKKCIAKYKKLLVETLFEEYSRKIEKAVIKSRVESLFPKENFYFYKLVDDETEKKLEQE